MGSLFSSVSSWPLGGELTCLLAALCWSSAVTLLGPVIERLGAQAVNLFKNVLTLVLLGLTLLLVGGWSELTAASWQSLALIFASGLLGLALGDTALLAAVPRLGVHRTLLWQTTGPIFAAILAFALYGDLPTLLDGLGAAVVLLGVWVVVSDRPSAAAPRESATEASAAGSRSATSSLVAIGTVLAILAAFGQGAGVVVAKAGMADLGAISATWVRLLAGALGVAAALAIRGQLGSTVRSLASWREVKSLTPATLLGTYIGMVLMMAGIAATHASVAAVLLATSPIFSLFIDARLEARRIPIRGLVGTVIAVVGVGVLAAG
ncbi:MAG: DMT family transporter [Acidobacteriota bacterium]